MVALCESFDFDVFVAFTASIQFLRQQLRISITTAQLNTATGHIPRSCSQNNFLFTVRFDVNYCAKFGQVLRFVYNYVRLVRDCRK